MQHGEWRRRAGERRGINHVSLYRRVAFFLACLGGIIFSPVSSVKLRAQTVPGAETPAATGRIVLVVHSSIADQISASLDQFVVDLEHAGHSVLVYEYTSGSAASLRSYLAGLYYDDPESLSGAVFIGKIPYVNFEEIGFQTFPSDTYFMDLDGVFTDTNGNGTFDNQTGNRDLEIWVSRIKTDKLDLIGAEADIVNSYLGKDHRYRVGKLATEPKALLYCDGAFCPLPQETIDPNNPMQSVYGPGNVALITAQSKTYFLNTLMAKPFEFIMVIAHGNVTSQHIWSCTPAGSCKSNGYVYNTDYLAHDPPWFFYIMMSCNVCRYTDSNYLCGIFVFNPDDSGLWMLGNSKTFTFNDTYSMGMDMAPDDSMGELYVNNFNAMVAMPGFTSQQAINNYGFVMIGDAFLQLKMSLRDYDLDGMPNDWENAHPCMNVEAADQDGDLDNDGLTNRDELLLSTDPCNPDTDGDGMDDGWEASCASRGLDPLAGDSLADSDNDAFTNLQEYRNQTDPCVKTPKKRKQDPFPGTGGCMASPAAAATGSQVLSMIWLLVPLALPFIVRFSRRSKSLQ